METYKLGLYGSDVKYDSGIPVDLAKHFTKLRDDLIVISEGIYEASPFVYEPEGNGLTVCIYEKRDGQIVKTKYRITLNKIN